MSVTRDAAARARTDVGFFARALIGEPLWPHQLEVATSEARIRCVCSGRQAGKSRTLAVMALHEAFRRRDVRVLLLSAGEDAARDLLAEVSSLASSPLLTGAVVDDNSSLVTLSNGSTIRSVPASQKQVRGKAVDLLILDEAAFIDEQLWSAARYTIIARAGSRVVMSSTPWGRRDRFFSVNYRAGLGAAEGYESFHWPSTVSPIVDTELLAMWRSTATDREYRTEVLAEWVDDQGAYFSADELESAVERGGGYDLVTPDEARGLTGFAGVDWGQRDANALAVLSRITPERAADTQPPGIPVGPLFVAWLDEQFARPYAAFIDDVVDAGTRGYRFASIRSETNGVGAMPTEVLRRRMADAGSKAEVAGVATTNATKQDGFGALKLLMEQGQLVLPRHPGLLRQLAALEYEQLDSGALRIAVPERAGHDDLAMALMLALTPQVEQALAWKPMQTAQRIRVIDRRLSGRRSRGGESDPSADDLLWRMAEKGDPTALRELDRRDRHRGRRW